MMFTNSHWFLNLRDILLSPQHFYDHDETNADRSLRYIALLFIYGAWMLLEIIFTSSHRQYATDTPIASSMLSTDLCFFEETTYNNSIFTNRALKTLDSNFALYESCPLLIMLLNHPTARLKMKVKFLKRKSTLSHSLTLYLLKMNKLILTNRPSNN